MIKNDNLEINEKTKYNTENEEKHENSNTRKSERSTKLPSKFNDYEMYMAFDAISYVENVPQHFKELENREDKKFWIDAVKRELEAINENETWELIETPVKGQILDTKWVFLYKPLEEKLIDKYKARLVVRGFAQKDNFKYDEIHSPVTKMSVIRTLLAVRNQFSFKFIQMDVKTAFLNGHLKDDIYIYPPKGVKHKRNKVYKLKKSLYGLRQSSKC